MKKVIPSIIILLFCIMSVAQVPESFSYQAIVQDGGVALSNQLVSYRFSIIKGSTSGEVVYLEKHSVTTNQSGLVTIAIGNGTDKTGDFSTIDWGANNYYLKIELDATGGTSYVDMGTTQLLSVPYAMHSKTADNVDELLLRVEILENKKVKDIDGNVYYAVAIGTQIWMSENLKTTKYSNGDAIPDGTGVGDISGETDPKYWFAVNDDLAKVPDYGRLYTWYAAMDIRNICPTGWHVPSDAEWHQLVLSLDPSAVLALDESSIAGGKMKETGTTHWIGPNVGATNSSGFTGLPGGMRWAGVKDGSTGTFGYWISSTEIDASNQCVRELDRGDAKIRRLTQAKNASWSVRCIKD